nr:MFS transporter [Rhodococcus rhodnii]
MFEDSGVDATGIAILFALWSVVSFAAEIPSGALADILPKRLVLAVSAVLYTAGFTVWLTWPVFAGFAVGFVVWGLASSLQSGTVESLVYEALDGLGRAADYPRIWGWAHAGAHGCTLVGTVLATPLYDVGGYAAVGWVSVAITIGNGLLVAALPREPRRRRDGERTKAGFGTTLRSGVASVARDRASRRLVVVTALLTGFLAYDEFFPLVAREGGASTTEVPLLVAITVVGQAVGAALAGRTAAVSATTLSTAVLGAAVVLAAGALWGGYGGFVAIAVGYGVLADVTVVTEARLQDRLDSDVRATGLSLAGFGGETSAVAIYAIFAVAGDAVPTAILLAALSVPLAATALLVRTAARA